VPVTTSGLDGGDEIAGIDLLDPGHALGRQYDAAPARRHGDPSLEADPQHAVASAVDSTSIAPAGG